MWVPFRERWRHDRAIIAGRRVNCGPVMRRKYAGELAIEGAKAVVGHSATNVTGI